MRLLSQVIYIYLLLIEWGYYKAVWAKHNYFLNDGLTPFYTIVQLMRPKTNHIKTG